ncbi:hypothetical protein GEV33_013041 [Tenebrio molitor]|uniref:TTF-type domain-containing protein n=1 Tax=Tenebrio molitor TaxID=7067 RepID=A0A8J6L6T4_TENMO|nr:hypothetical protein GEV33_013041 [Tenebrio molitor]
MFELVLNCVEKWHYKSKLIGQSFDGASVVPAQLDILQAKIKDVAPQALLVHCLTHPLNSVLQQSCNSVSTCRVFFATVSDLPTFFSRLKGTAIARRIPASAIARWTSSSDILSVVNNDWDSLKQVFTEVMNDSSYDSTCVRQSEAFLNKFNQFEFALLVVVFHDVFRLTGALCEALQKNSLDVRFCVVQVGNTLTLLNSKRSGVVFEKMFDLAALKALPSEGQKGKCEMLYYEILDALSLRISTRFKDMKKLEFVALMDNSKFGEYSQNFPTEALNSLKLSYPNLFQGWQRLKNELQFVYGDEDLRDNEQDFMEILANHMNIFKETYKLFCLILTMPSIGVSPESSFSCSERIKFYLRDTTEERLTSLAKISIERELLEELIDEQPFYDDIIDKFASLNERNLDLIPKKELVQDTTSRWRAIRDNYVRSLRKQAQHAGSGFKKIRPYIYGKELSFLTKSKELPTAEVNFEDNTDDRADNVDANDADVHLGSSEATFEDNSNELSYDPLDEIKTEADDGDVYLRPTEASFEDNVTETSHDRADYVSEVKTEADDIDIEEQLVNPSPINSVHVTKRKRLDIQHPSMDFTVMKSPLQEDDDLAFFYSLLPSLVPKFGKVVKFFKGSVHQRRGGHKRVSRIEDNIFSIYVYCEKVSVSNFLPGIVFGVDSFFTIALSFVLHKRRPRTGMSLQSPLQLQQAIVAGVVASLTMFPMQDPVCVLLQTPFRRWSDNDKKDFLSCERPMPLLNANQVRKVGNKVYYRNFNKSRYSQFEWLCGSYYLDKLFCFPCLIVDDKAGLWNKTGFNDLKNLGRGLHRHEESLEHLRCALDFSKLKKNLTCKDGAQENSRQHVSKQFNENMHRNRHFMQLPILAIMYLGRQELPFGHGNFEELLRVLSMSPGYLQEHYQQIKMVFADKTIQKDLVDSISQYIDEHVEKEIQESNFYSIQVEDISDVVQSPHGTLLGLSRWF